LKVITWNLGFWQHRSLHDAAWTYLIDQIKPDLALLQEVNPPKLHNEEHLSFREIHQNWGTALYTRNMPIEELRIAEEYPNRVAASIRIAPTKRILAVSVHAPIVNGRVFPYLDEIFDNIEGTVTGNTFTVGGDLNTARLAEKAWPRHGHGPFFEKLKNNIFFDCHQMAQGHEEQTIFRGNSKYPFQDDHLFVSHDLAANVKSCYVLNNDVVRSLSDHIPLVAEIDV